MTIELSQLKIGDQVPVPPKPKPEKEIMANWQGELTQPLVSIVCHTFNHVNYLEDALNGFLMQETDFPFEIILHDDASTDGTTEIVKRYSEAYPNIIVSIIQKENQYSKGNRPSKVTFPSARGSYIALCEGDDYWLNPKKIAVQLLVLTKNPLLYLSIHPAYQLNIIDGKTTKAFDKGNVERVLRVEDAVCSRSQFSPTASYFFNKEECLSMPNWFYDSKDLPFGDYFIECMLGRNGILYIPEYSSVYRRDVPGSYTETGKQLSIGNALIRMKAVLKYTEKLNIYPTISESSIAERRLKVIADYQNMAIMRNSYEMFKKINRAVKKTDLLFVRRFAGTNHLAFFIYRNLLRAKSFIKRTL